MPAIMNPSQPHHPGRSDFSRSRQVIHIDLRAFNAKRIKEIATKGEGLIQILGSSDQDCPACSALDGQTFKAAQVPTIPPENCSCLPYCTCVTTVITKKDPSLKGGSGFTPRNVTSYLKPGPGSNGD
jgi:hypothetical protein